MLDYREMLRAGIHFGHKTSLGCPKMRPYLWKAKNKIHLIDVSKTAILLERAAKFLTESTATGKTLLWVGTKKPAHDIIEKNAGELRMPFVVKRWVGGTLSNFDQVKKGIARLLHLRDVVKKSSTYYKKKEIVMIQKEIDRLEKNVGGIIGLEYPPAALIVVDAKKEQAAIKEASTLGIPVVAMVDTNTNPDGVSYIIPANDDAPKSIAFVIEYLAQAAKDGQKLCEEKKAQERADRLSAIEAKKATVKPKVEAAPAAATQAPAKDKEVAKEAKPAAQVKPEKAPADQAAVEEDKKA